MRRGTTLIELTVTLVVMGVLAALAAMSVGALHPLAINPRDQALARARAMAIRSGHPVTAGGPSPALFLPDGRVVGRGIDPLTGVPNDAAR